MGVDWGGLIASSARIGLSAQWAEREPGMCARWVRQVLENAGALSQSFLHAPDAKMQCEAFRRHCHIIQPGSVLCAGDLLYKVGPSAGRHGHVGIVISPRVVAENSSCHYGHELDARGTRTVVGFGRPDVILRWKNRLPPLL
jgi:hypothetical protein